MLKPEENIRGIYRVYSDTVSYIGFSHNVRGTLKRLRFELAMNACSYRPLQRLWNQNDGLEMELLEQYEPDAEMADEELEAHLTAKLFVWKGKLEGEVYFLQTAVAV